MWSFFFIPLPPTKILFLLNFPITTTNDHSIFANGRYQSSLKSWSFSFTRHCLCKAIPAGSFFSVFISQPVLVSSSFPMPWSRHHHLLHGLLWQPLIWSLPWSPSPSTQWLGWALINVLAYSLLHTEVSNGFPSHFKSPEFIKQLKWFRVSQWGWR